MRFSLINGTGRVRTRTHRPFVHAAKIANFAGLSLFLFCAEIEMRLACCDSIFVFISAVVVWRFFFFAINNRFASYSAFMIFLFSGFFLLLLFLEHASLWIFQNAIQRERCSVETDREMRTEKDSRWKNEKKK